MPKTPAAPQEPEEHIEGRWIIDPETGERLRMAHFSEGATIKDGKTAFKFRWNIQGVHYPEELINPKNFTPGGRFAALKALPKGYITTAEAAKILQSSCSSARAVLHRHKVSHKFFIIPKRRGNLLAWKETAVRRIAESRNAIIETAPEGCIDSEQTRAILGIGRSTLYRYEQKGIIPRVPARLMTARGTRKKHYYKLELVQALAAKIRLIRKAERELDAMLDSRKPVNHLTRDNNKKNPPSKA